MIRNKFSFPMKRFADAEARRESLRPFARNMRVLTMSQMAYAGFFYSGFNDTVVCFFCGIAVNDWDDSRDTDPLIEHARWNPNCAFVHKVSRSPLRQPRSRLSRSSLVIPCETPMLRAQYERYSEHLREHRRESDLLQSVIRRVAQTYETVRRELRAEREVLRDVEVKLYSLYVASNKQRNNNGVDDEIPPYVEYSELIDVLSNLAFRLQNRTVSEIVSLYERVSSTTTTSHANANGNNNNTLDVTRSPDNTMRNTALNEMLREHASVFETTRESHTTPSIALNVAAANEDEICSSSEVNNDERQDVLSPPTSCCCCMDLYPRIVFVPCMHLVCCDNCGRKLSHCPICRSFVWCRLLCLT